jgi:hypothetical protein
MSHVSERYKQLLNQLQEAEETAADPVMELQLGKLRNSGSNMVKHGQTWSNCETDTKDTKSFAKQTDCWLGIWYAKNIKQLRTVIFGLPLPAPVPTALRQLQPASGIDEHYWVRCELSL